MRKRERLALVSDAQGSPEVAVIGPIEGTALYHFADLSGEESGESVVDAFQEYHDKQVADEWGETLSY